jgi:hypothetical protein
MASRTPLAAAALLALSCARASTVPLSLSPVPPGQPDDDFQSTGEVTTKGESTAFNDWRVVGPRVNLTRRADGTWAGNLVGRNYILKPGPGSLSAPGADLHFLRWGKDIAVLGNLGELKIRIRIVPGEGLRVADGKVCRVGGAGSILVDCTPEEARASPGIHLRGQAAQTQLPEMPQLALALIAITYIPLN